MVYIHRLGVRQANITLTLVLLAFLLSFYRPGNNVLLLFFNICVLLPPPRQYQFYAAKAGVHFQLGAVTVDPLSSAYDPRPLVPYLQQLGVADYLYEQQDIMRMALEAGASSICAYCSRMKRGTVEWCIFCC